MDPNQPNALRVNRWVRLVAYLGLAALSVLVLSLALGVTLVDRHSGRLDSVARLVQLEAQNEAMVEALSGLDSRLGDLGVEFAEARGVAGEARELVGLDPDLTPIQIGEPGWPTNWSNTYAVALSRSGYQVGNALRQARELRVAYREVVARMEREADAWACIPSTQPLEKGRLTSSFGRRRDPFTGRMAWHRGVDISAPTGTPVLASAEGVVIRSGYYGSYGRLVEVDHGNGLRTRYAHNSKVLVEPGQWVRRGDVLAHVGSTGRANAPHLHYEVHLGGEAVNPEPYLIPELLAD